MSGARPGLYVVLSGYRSLGGPLGHHREWVRNSSCSSTRPHAHERFTLCAILELGTMLDQLNTPALLAFEVLGRRIQLIESAYELSADGKSPDFFRSDDINRRQYV